VKISDRSSLRLEPATKAGALLSGLSLAVPWLTLGLGYVGLWMAWPSMWEGPVSKPQSIKPCGDSAWNRDLIGKRVKIPQSDMKGAEIPQFSFVVALRCVPCNGPEEVQHAAAAARSKPVLVLYYGDERELPRSWLDDTDNVRIVIASDFGDATLGLFKGSMQAAELDDEGRIVRVPDVGEPIAEFLGERFN